LVWRNIVTHIFCKVCSEDVLQCHFSVSTPCIFARICLHIHVCSVTIFKHADGLKMRDIKLKCGSFESRNMVFNTSYKICLHNVETDYLETFAKC